VAEGQKLGHAYADAIIASPVFQEAVSQARVSGSS
jgi:acid phosphatase (class A)